MQLQLLNFSPQNDKGLQKRTKHEYIEVSFFEFVHPCLENQYLRVGTGIVHLEAETVFTGDGRPSHPHRPAGSHPQAPAGEMMKNDESKN